MKACPFCGSHAVKITNSWTASYQIECDCGASVHGMSADALEFEGKTHAGDVNFSEIAHRSAAEDALSRWNMRTP